jgi:hypothetical protein
MEDVQTKGEPLTLKRERQALQKALNFIFFLYLWIIFALLDQVPAYKIQCASMMSH